MSLVRMAPLSLSKKTAMRITFLNEYIIFTLGFMVGILFVQLVDMKTLLKSSNEKMENLK